MAKKKAVSRKPKAVSPRNPKAASRKRPRAAGRKVSRSFSTPVAGGTSKGSWHFPPRKAGEPHYWLLKQEPTDFSFDDLLAVSSKTTNWEGVRNHVARNFLRDGMAVGDMGFFYHSNANPSAVVGIVEIVRAGYPDATAFDKKSDYYDAGSKPDAPVWFQVDVRAIRKLPRAVSIADIKSTPALASMVLLHISQLSVQPVSAREWAEIVAIGEMT